MDIGHARGNTIRTAVVDAIIAGPAAAATSAVAPGAILPTGFMKAMDRM
jgi:hypothetical protein